MTRVAQTEKNVVIIYPKLKPTVEDKPMLPLQVLAIAGPLLKAGFGVKILDERAEDDLIGNLSHLTSAPICFGISAMFSHQPKSGLNIAGWIRANFPGTPIVWGGWFPTLLPMLTIADPHVDIIVKGKGETTFTELVTALYDKQPIDGIAGLIYKEDGEVKETPDRPLEDPNTFPYKPYHLLKLDKYCSSDGIVNFNSSYGCPFRCKFCGISATLKKQWNKGLSPERVMAEIDDLINNYGIKIKHLIFQEDNFFNNSQRAKKILQLITERGLNITWDANMRIDQYLRFDPELLRLIKKSGCSVLHAGAESANQRMLDFICKDLKVSQIEKAVEIARDYDLPLILNFIAGLPGETEESFKETLTKIKQLYTSYPKLKTTIFQYFTIPGTPFFNMENEQGLINEPKTYTEWAEIASDSMFLTPLALNNKLARYNNRKFKIMSFYFSFAYQMENIAPGDRSLAQTLKMLLKKISVFRFENNFWYFPLEWSLARLIKDSSFLGRWKKR